MPQEWSRFDPFGRELQILPEEEMMFRAMEDKKGRQRRNVTILLARPRTLEIRQLNIWTIMMNNRGFADIRSQS